MDYISALPGLIAQSVKAAKAKLTAAIASVAVGKEEGISFNRRVLREGVKKAIWQPQKINPATDKPAGPIDPDVGVVAFHGTGADATLMASAGAGCSSRLAEIRCLGRISFPSGVKAMPHSRVSVSTRVIKWMENLPSSTSTLGLMSHVDSCALDR